MRKILFILLFCLISCKQDLSVATIRRDLGLPTVTINVKGKSTQMIMDTGGAVTILDDDFARELGIIPSGESMELRGYGGSRKLLEAEEVVLYLEDIPLHGKVYISDIDNIMSTKQVKGILGIEHLQNSQIDLRSNTITVE
jgi:hypothetical protein